MLRTKFIPRIWLCGDEMNFLAKVDARPYKIVRKSKNLDELDIKNFDALKNFLLGGEVDYLVFTTRELFREYHHVSVMHGLVSPKAVTVEQFNALPRDFFYDPNVGLRLLAWMQNLSIKTLLDVDGFFADAKIFTKPAESPIIDCVTEKTLPPIAENIYRRMYKNLAEVGLKRYDAVLLIEREPTDFDVAYALTENFSDKIFTFGRKGSELERHLTNRKEDFSDGKGFRLMTGNLLFVKRKKPPESFRMFVVTHKKVDMDLPDTYKIIHAGHALSSETFGELIDDTGDNISELNPYLNELTALYWIWKNTSDTIVGLCHYRRFFTTGDEKFSRDKILSEDDALKILATHDMIVSRLFYGVMTQREFVENDCGERLAKIGEAILRKHLLRVHPDYADATDFVLNSKAIYKCNMFVTRREILDAFCKWLFAFITDATREILRVLQLEKLSYTPRRLMSFLAERMLHVWLFKQNLRLKELNFMFVEGI